MIITTFVTHTKISIHLTGLDWLVFFAAFACSLALIFYGHHRKKNLKQTPSKQASLLEYMLMGRQLTLPLFVATLVTTWYGGIFGVTQIAFEQGIYNLFTQGIFWYVTYIIFAFFLVKKIRSYGALTLPELVHKTYGAKSAKLTAVFVFIKTLPITYAISIGLLLQCFLPLTLMEATSVGVAVIVLYALSGGLRTVVYSDVALFIIMCLGVSSVLIFSILQFGGLSFLQANLPPSYFSPCGTNSISTTLVWFILACSTTFISPAFYQRCLAAFDDRTAIKGILISTAIWFIFDICTTFGAMYAKAVIPEADSLYAYITYGVQLLPAGFRGLLLASIAAAIIATLDSFLFIASNILFYDLPILKLHTLKVRQFAALIATAILTVLLAVCFNGRIETVWLVLKSYFTACLLLPILFGYYFPRLANDKLFVTNAVVSCISITFSHMYFIEKQLIDSFYVGCLASCAVFGIYYIIKPEKTLESIYNN